MNTRRLHTQWGHFSLSASSNVVKKQWKSNQHMRHLWLFLIRRLQQNHWGHCWNSFKRTPRLEVGLLRDQINFNCRGQFWHFGIWQPFFCIGIWQLLDLMFKWLHMEESLTGKTAFGSELTGKIATEGIFGMWLQVRDAGNLLTRAGFTLPGVDVDEYQVRYNSALELIEHLRAMGETNALVNRIKFLKRDTALATAAVYESMFAAEDGTIPATFQVIYMMGWKEHESQQKAKRWGSATLSFKDIQKELTFYSILMLIHVVFVD
ncbi:hypothetical protein LXL04_020297 [Taraxacum kok-saghyz]